MVQIQYVVDVKPKYVSFLQGSTITYAVIIKAEVKLDSVSFSEYFILFSLYQFSFVTWLSWILGYREYLGIE